MSRFQVENDLPYDLLRAYHPISLEDYPILQDDILLTWQGQNHHYGLFPLCPIRGQCNQFLYDAMLQ